MCRRSILTRLTLTSALILGAIAPAHATEQGWSLQEREQFYWAPQGSRIMPLAWFRALEKAGSDERFATMPNLTRYGFLPPPEGLENPFPIGVTSDQQDARQLTYSNIDWYQGQPQGEETAEAWVGLTCAACHTGSYTHDGARHYIDGGQANLDFQTFIEEMDEALSETNTSPEKFDRFASAVLAGRDTPANREALEGALGKLVDWQARTAAMNASHDIRYGHGRLDAFGHIFNKVLMFLDEETSEGNRSDAPVSYPFLWNIWKQSVVQWNGIAENRPVKLLDGFDYGALGRNAGQVVGVFGDVAAEPVRAGILQRFKGFDSSIKMRNLLRIEKMLRDLQPPAWPEDQFGEINQAWADEGEALFKHNCASCHLTEEMQASVDHTEVMVDFRGTSAGNLTDIWMACNAYTYRGPSGVLGGADASVDPEESVAKLLGITVRQTLYGKKTDILKEAIFPGDEIALPERRGVATEAASDARNEEARKRCMTDIPEKNILAYKARPLDGIWASPPYLHNGSVASLYELLLPPEERMKEFWIGNTEFDPEKVGYLTTAPANGQGMMLRVRRDSGAVIEGNSNAGHDYGASGFSEHQRRALVEYMKTL